MKKDEMPGHSARNPYTNRQKVWARADQRLVDRDLHELRQLRTALDIKIAEIQKLLRRDANAAQGS